MNALNNFDKTDREWLLAPVDGLIRFWRLKVKVKVTARCRCGEDIHFDAVSSKFL